MSATPTVRPPALLANTLAAAQLICASTDACPLKPITPTSHPSPVGEDIQEKNMNDPEILTVAEAAELLRLSKNNVYERIRSGELPSFRLGKAIRISKPALLAFLERLQRGQSGG